MKLSDQSYINDIMEASSHQIQRTKPSVGFRAANLHQPAALAQRTLVARLSALRAARQHLHSRPATGQNRDGLLLAVKIVGALVVVVGLVALLATASASTLTTVGVILAAVAALIGVVLAFESL